MSWYAPRVEGLARTADARKNQGVDAAPRDVIAGRNQAALAAAHGFVAGMEDVERAVLADSAAAGGRAYTVAVATGLAAAAGGFAAAGLSLWLLRRHLRSRAAAEVESRRALLHATAVSAFRDETEKKAAAAAVRESERRFRFLSELAAATQPLADPDGVMKVTARLLGTHLAATRCAYADVAPDGDHFVIRDDWTDGAASTAGAYSLDLFGPRAAADMRAGRTLVVRDVGRELSQDGGADTFNAIGVEAIVCCPLVKEGRLVAMMAVHHAAPRDWAAAEVALVQEVVERSWAHLERVRVEADLRRREATTRFLAATASAVAEVDDPSETMRRLAAAAVPGFADWCAVDLVADDGTRERVAVVHADPALVRLAVEAREKHPHRGGDSAGAGPVLSDGEPRLVADVTAAVLRGMARDEDHLAFLERLGLRSVIAVPLVSRGRLLGAATFATAESGRRYDRDDLAAAADVARRAATGLEKARLYQALREQDKRKDEFLAILAHELRNPLAPVRNGVKILRLASGPAVLDRTLAMMERQLAHMVHLIDDLVDVSRVSRGKVVLRRERVELRSVVDAAVETTRPAIDAAGHELVVDLPAEPLVFDGDRTRLAQVFANLLHNAGKYTPPGGRIALTARRDGAEAVVRVADTGVGIPADMLPRIFDMFTQVGASLERSQGGLGIGLTLVRRLAELHGGRVGAGSAGAGRGSEFTVRLPLAAESVAR